MKEVLSLLSEMEKKSEEGEKETGQQAKISEALETVNRMKCVAPLIPDLVRERERVSSVSYRL